MSDDRRSLHEELEVRVVALLTGELSESEADELETVLETDESLAACRDRMAELMGDLHESRDEIAPPAGEPPLRLSEERRAKIFANEAPAVWATRPRTKEVPLKRRILEWAAALAVLLMLAAIFIPSVGSVRQLASVSREQADARMRELERANREVAENGEDKAASLEQRSDENTDVLIAYEDFANELGPAEKSLESARRLAPPALTMPSADRFVAADEGRDRAAGPVDPFAPSPAAGMGKPEPDATAGEDSGSGVAGFLKRGRKDFLNGDYDSAAEAFAEVEAQDEGNREAALFSTRLKELREDESEMRSQLSSSMVTEVDRSRSQPKAFEESQVLAAPDRSFSDKPRSIVIPQVNFSGMPLSQVVETLEELSREYDPEGAGVEIRLAQPEGQDPRVNISLRNLDLDRVLQFVTRQVNYDFTEEDGEFIRVQPGGYSPVEQLADRRAKQIRQTPKHEKLTANEPVSTFSLNVSDVSFRLAQAALTHSRVPPASQIRTEEFVNSFDYGDPAPRADQPVALHWEMAQHPYAHDRQVVRFSLQTQAVGRAPAQPLNLSLLVDNSGSMQRPDRQAILQECLQSLNAKLSERDQLNITLFARQPRLVAEADTRASQQAAVDRALAYRPEGGTNLEAGLEAAYASARRNFDPKASNRVILMTDGAANLGNVDSGELAEMVVAQRKRGIALDAYGIGWDNYNDALLEAITRNGDGRYAFLNSPEDAAGDFAEKLAGTLRVAAADVKVQVRWNPERVKSYRQIGYDLHRLKKEDFYDDTVDAAEIGEAESGTALYVVQIDDDPEIVGGLGTLHVLYRVPATGEYEEHSWPLPMPRRIPAMDQAGPSLRLAAASAFFAERLADNPYGRGYDFGELYALTEGLPDAFPTQPRVSELQTMIRRARTLYTVEESR